MAKFKKFSVGDKVVPVTHSDLECIHDYLIPSEIYTVTHSSDFGLIDIEGVFSTCASKTGNISNVVGQKTGLNFIRKKK